ncbi:MAG: hypothetical protein OXE94_01900, partial [Aestuariivita sp.]|nr:hypothetical protein [Aestuariivita sp.]
MEAFFYPVARDKTTFARIENYPYAKWRRKLKRGEPATDGNVAIGHIKVKLVTLPTGFMPFGVAFGANVTGVREISK